MNRYILVLLFTLPLVIRAEPVKVHHADKKARHEVAVADSKGTDSKVKWKDIKDNLDAVDTAMEAISWGTSTNNVWSGNEKIYQVNLKDNVQSLKAAVKNLNQALTQLVKKQKEMDENRKAAGL